MSFQVNSLNKRYGVLAIVAILIVVVVIVSVSNHHTKKPTTLAKSTNTTSSKHPAVVPVAPTGIVYPSTWTVASEITKSDAQQGVISEAVQTSVGATVTIRNLSGNLAKNFSINDLPNQVVDSLSGSISGFSLLSKSIQQIQSYNTAVIEYTSKDSSGKSIINEMFIIPTEKNTFYITYSYEGNSFSNLQSDISSINDSVASYIKTHTT